MKTAKKSIHFEDGYDFSNIRMNGDSVGRLHFTIGDCDNIIDTVTVGSFEDGTNITGIGVFGYSSITALAFGEDASISNFSSTDTSVTLTILNSTITFGDALVEAHYFFEGIFIGDEFISLRGGVPILGCEKSESLYGFDTNDSTGEAYDDTLRGFGGDDQLRGGDGDDILDGGVGKDYMEGGEGDDVYVVRRGEGNPDRSLFGFQLDAEIIREHVGEGFDTLRFEDINSTEVRVIGLRQQTDNGLFTTFTHHYFGIEIPGIGEDRQEIYIYIGTTRSGKGLTPEERGIRYTDPWSFIESIEFADGVVWNAANDGTAFIRGTDEAEILSGNGVATAIFGLGGDDTIRSDGTSTTLDGGPGDDLFEQGNADNTYVWNLGDGNDTIFDAFGNDRISFGSGIGAADLILSLTEQTVANVGSTTLQLRIGSETIMIRDHFKNTPFGGGRQNLIETAIFADGTSISLLEGVEIRGTDSRDQITSSSLGITGAANINGMGGDDVITTASRNDTITGGTGNDDLQGFQGDDTYIWNIGDGNDTITDNLGNDKILLGPGITANDIKLSIPTDANGNLLNRLQINIGSENITAIFSSGGAPIETLQFSDGSTQSLIKDLTLHGTEVNDKIIGFSFPDAHDTIHGYGGDDFLAGGGNVSIFKTITIYGGDGNDQILDAPGNDLLVGEKGNDIINSGRGNDTIIWNIGDGNDVVFNTPDNSHSFDDRLVFGSGITAKNLSFTLQQAPSSIPSNAFYALDLSIHIGNETIQLNDQFFAVGNGPLTATLEKLQFADGSTMDLDYALFDPALQLTNTGAPATEDTTLAITSTQLNAIAGELTNNPSQNVYTLQTPPSHGSLFKGATKISAGGTFTQKDIDDGLITYKPDLNYDADDSFGFSVSNGASTLSNKIFTIDITPVNDEPIATADFATTASNQSVIINVLSNDTDIDGDSLVVAVPNGAGVPLPQGTTTVNPNNTITFTPAPGFVGTTSFAYQISDGNGGFDTATVTVTVAAPPPVNTAPVAQNDSASVQQGQTKTINVLANDSDSDRDTLTPTIDTNPSHGTVTVNANKTISYTAHSNYSGADSFTYRVSDGKGGFDAASVNLTVTAPPPPPPPPPPVNTAPIAQNDSLTLQQGQTKTIAALANDSDADGDTLTPTITANPSHGSVTINEVGTFIYTAAANYSGADSFTYRISDGEGGFDTATVNITVTSPIVTDPPIVNNPPVVETPPVVADPPVAPDSPVLPVPPIVDGSPVVETPPVVPDPPVAPSPDWVGTAFADRERGTAEANRMSALAGDDTVSGGGGADTMRGGSGDDLLKGQAGDDILMGQGGVDTLKGGGGGDMLKGGGGGDLLVAQGGDDTVKGGGGDDTIKGGGGDDRLEGQRGDDLLIGQSGRDVFVFKPGAGSDEIRGFQQGVDLIEITRGASSFADLDVIQSGGDVLIAFANVEITVKNARVAQFDADDFIFG